MYMGYPETRPTTATLMVPFAIPVENGVANGRKIIIRGHVPYNSDVFAINLQSGQSLSDFPRPETSIHLSVRFSENVVVRNSFQNGDWGREERGGGMPFRCQQSFEMTILIDAYDYKISVNGDHFTSYEHRMAKEIGNFVRIDGRVRIDQVLFDSISGTAAMYQPQVNPIYHNPMVPFEENIGPMSPGRMVFISGVPTPHSRRFTFNLQCGYQHGADVALHFDVRFNENSVVRNTMMSGNWGTEDKRGHFPFTPNTQFEIIVLCEPHCYKVAVNNQHYTEYYHRITQLNCVNSLTVTGDVKLQKIRIQ